VCDNRDMAIRMVLRGSGGTDLGPGYSNTVQKVYILYIGKIVGIAVQYLRRETRRRLEGSTLIGV
jgi:hypothetical protein